MFKETALLTFVSGLQFSPLADSPPLQVLLVVDGLCPPVLGTGLSLVKPCLALLILFWVSHSQSQSVTLSGSCQAALHAVFGSSVNWNPSCPSFYLQLLFFVLFCFFAAFSVKYYKSSLKNLSLIMAHMVKNCEENIFLF